MGVWGDRLLPRVLDAMGSAPEITRLRAEVCAGLHGTVLELGFGSGLNVPHYPAAVTEVLAVEPSDAAWALSERRRAASAVPVRRSGLDGQRLTEADDSVDCVLSTLTLCTIPDVARALAEVRRVLRPGGTLHVFEHGLAPDAGVETWQHRLEPAAEAGVRRLPPDPGRARTAHRRGVPPRRRGRALPRGPADDASVELRPPGPGQRARTG